MINTIKLSGPNIKALGDRIEREGLVCLDRIDSMTLCSMLLGIATNKYGGSSVSDISNGILNSCGDQSTALAGCLINRYMLGTVWKYTTDFGVDVFINKIPKEIGRNAIVIDIRYETVAKELDGTEYEASVYRPLIEYDSTGIVVFKTSSKQNFAKGDFNKTLFHPELEPHRPVEQDEAEEWEKETTKESSDTVDEVEPSNQEEPATEARESTEEEQEETDEGSTESNSHDTDDTGDEQESAEPEEGDAGSESDGGTGGYVAPGVDEAPAEEQDQVDEQPKEETEVNTGSRNVYLEVMTEYTDSALDVRPHAQASKSELYDKIMINVGQTLSNIDENNTEESELTEIVLNKLLESPIAKGKLLDRDYEICGVRYDFDKGYTVTIKIKEPERALQEAMQSDKGDEPVKTDYVDITDPEYRNGTLLAMFGTTAPSANHVHTFLNDYHNTLKTKSFLETKVDGQGTYPTESDVCYDNVIWALVKMKDGKFWRIAIANRDFSLPDESWIATHHMPGRWVTLVEVQDGPSFHCGYRRRSW